MIIPVGITLRSRIVNEPSHRTGRAYGRTDERTDWTNEPRHVWIQLNFQLCL